MPIRPLAGYPGRPEDCTTEAYYKYVEDKRRSDNDGIRLK